MGKKPTAVNTTYAIISKEKVKAAKARTPNRTLQGIADKLDADLVFLLEKRKVSR